MIPRIHVVSKLSLAHGAQHSPHEALVKLLELASEERAVNALSYWFSFQEGIRMHYACGCNPVRLKQKSHIVDLNLRDSDGHVWQEESVSLMYLFRKWHEEVPGDCKYSCEQHGGEYKGQSSCILRSEDSAALPHCLTFNIVREYYDNGTCVDPRPVSIEHRFNLHSLGNQEIENSSYKLRAVLHKYGSANAGHWVCNVLHKSSWVKISVANVVDVENGTDLGFPYYATMAFYVKT